ncbi:hypothetical protein APY03_3126 [Variovorax sp. WDL1]|nr:hypothetical protein APY03_3126 [Variovorax sp. WDL1]
MVMVIGLGMVRLAGRLIARGLAWQVDAQNFAVLQQALQLSIDR